VKDTSPWAAVDHVFWTSAIFSRQAMRLNHVSAHRYGDRKALGIFRIIAVALMLGLTGFLTVYEILVTKSRPWFTMNWWVCVGTLFFFAVSLIPAKYYFQAIEPDPRKAPDGSNPFYSWKFTALVYCFMLQASIHLVILECL